MRFKPARHTLLLSALALALSTVSSFADALVPVAATPYDRQMTPIHSVLTSGGASADRTSLMLVNEWMADLRDIPYGYQLVWKTPSDVASRRPADCKGKAVALYHRMQSNGASNVRLVIGKRAPTSRMTHAWLEWDVAGSSYVLDPTFNYNATRSEKVGRGCYVPLYAYAGAKKFRAANNLVAQN